MNAKISKTNEETLAFFNARLDEVRLSGYDRLRAKAQMARAEAFADAVATIYKAITGLFQGSDKGHGRAAPSAG
jgi:hypothetical protein